MYLESTGDQPLLQQFCWSEWAAERDGKFSRHHFIRLDDQHARNEFLVRHAPNAVYCSMGCAREANWNGPAACPSFCLDFDAHDGKLEQARSQLLRVANQLNQKYGVSPDSVDVKFTTRGYHLTVLATVYGCIVSLLLLHLWKAKARALFEAGFNRIDPGIYQPSRLIRVANTRHQVTRLFAIPLSLAELQDLSCAEHAEMAQQPRDVMTMAVPEHSLRFEAAVREGLIWVEARLGRPRPSSTQKPQNGWQLPPCIRRVERETLPDGIRHDVYYTLARAYATTGMAPEEAVQRLQEIDARHPIHDPDYIERTVVNGWKRPGLSRCPNRVLEPYCDPSRCNCARSRGASAPR